MMIGHYLVNVLARFRKAPFTTGANILTLALGLACFIAAYGIASYWRSGDTYHANAARTFVVGQSSTPINQVEPNATQTLSSAALGRYLATDFPEIEQVARVYTEERVPATAGSNAVLLESAFADPAFLDIFDFEFLAGDARSALDEPGSVVLTQDAARRLFGDAPALGQAVLIDAEHEATVTGVIAPVRQPSFMGASADAAVRFDMLGRWDLMPAGVGWDAQDIWLPQVRTFVMLPPGGSVDALMAQLPAFAERRVAPEISAFTDVDFEAFPVSEMTTRALDSMLFSNSAFGLTAMSALLGLGALTLLVASVNYANLATAQAAARAREIGLRKTLGARRAQIMLQTWAEAGVLTIVATLLAFLVLALSVPAVRAQTGIDLLYFLSQGPAPFGVLATLVVAVALVAGAWPALVLSGLRPTAVLRPGRARGGSKRIARVLVGVQFAAASFLLIVLTVAQLQRAYLEREALGARSDPVVVLNDIGSLGIDYDTLAGALTGQPGVASVSETDSPPWMEVGTGWPLARSPEPDASAAAGLLKFVAHDYFETLGQELLAGRIFARDRETGPQSIFARADQTAPVVIDRAFAAALGYASPAEAVDEIVYVPESRMRILGGSTAQPARIIGVVETDMTRVDFTGAVGSIYTFVPGGTFTGEVYPLVRLARADVAAGLQSIERAWRSLAPAVAVDIQFTDQLFGQAYRQYARVSQLFVLLAGVAFIIASVGLIGIAVHVTARRRHEIGVRKVLGASTRRVLRMLIADFSKPVAVGNLIAWPFAWMAAQTYLQGFAYRTPLTPAPFIVSLILTLLIAWASVGGQAWKAARVKPALVLKAE